MDLFISIGMVILFYLGFEPDRLPEFEFNEDDQATLPKQPEQLSPSTRWEDFLWRSLNRLAIFARNCHHFLLMNVDAFKGYIIYKYVLYRK